MVEPARSAQPDFKPHLFGKFFVLQRLAVGGMAEIYRAKVVGAAGFEKELALKRILASRSQDEGFIKMLVNEAKLTAQLTHSNIAQIFECGAVEGADFGTDTLVRAEDRAWGLGRPAPVAFPSIPGTSSIDIP